MCRLINQSKRAASASWPLRAARNWFRPRSLLTGLRAPPTFPHAFDGLSPVLHQPCNASGGGQALSGVLSAALAHVARPPDRGPPLRKVAAIVAHAAHTADQPRVPLPCPAAWRALPPWGLPLAVPVAAGSGNLRPQRPARGPPPPGACLIAELDIRIPAPSGSPPKYTACSLAALLPFQPSRFISFLPSFLIPLLDAHRTPPLSHHPRRRPGVPRAPQTGCGCAAPPPELRRAPAARYVDSAVEECGCCGRELRWLDDCEGAG